MASKKKMILEQTLNRYCADPNDKANCNSWIVLKVTNSTTPRVHDVLYREEVNGYCEREDWEVTIQ